ncbi:hypothetical protein ACIBF5_10545 [Micromonospora sp. NPDC050417]|uniref:hypothetical protein n=1 Tax=Micromonospora sp. NPDC050417 TaxID=3364280 RepID=UPI00378DE50D
MTRHRYAIHSVRLAGATTVMSILLSGCGAGTPRNRPTPTPRPTTPAVGQVGGVDGEPMASSTPPGGLPGADRQVMVVGVAPGREEPALSVSADDTIGAYPASADTGDWEFFVLVPVDTAKTRHHLRTAVSADGGEPFCVAADRRDARLVLAPCDAGNPAQDVRTAFAGADPQGRPTFGLTVADRAIAVSAEPGRAPGFTLTPRGTPSTGTAFVFVDAGPAPAPVGD